MNDAVDVVVSTAATADLLDIVDYLTLARGADAATAFVDAMLERIATLSRFPNRGPVPREIEDAGHAEFRQTSFGRYRIIYEVRPTQVTIVLVADGRRDMAVLLRQRVLDSDPPD